MNVRVERDNSVRENRTFTQASSWAVGAMRSYNSEAEAIHRETCDDPEWCTYPKGENHCQAAVDAESEAAARWRERRWRRRHPIRARRAWS